jgi:hypothetical protein
MDEAEREFLKKLNEVRVLADAFFSDELDEDQRKVVLSLLKEKLK